MNKACGLVVLGGWRCRGARLHHFAPPKKKKRKTLLIVTSLCGTGTWVLVALPLGRTVGVGVGESEDSPGQKVTLM